MNRILPVAAGFTALLACQPAADLDSDFYNDLTTFSGCGDVYLYAADEADEVAVFADFDALLDGLDITVEEHELAFDLSNQIGVDVTAVLGTNVSHTSCNDALEFEPFYEETWVPVSGTATLTVRPNAAVDDSVRVDLVLEDVVFSYASGGDITVPSITWTNISVGWLPG